MSDSGKRFADAMKDESTSAKNDARFEAVAKGLHMAMRNLLVEIQQKPAEIRTDAENTFVNAFVSITILGILSVPMGGKP